MKVTAELMFYSSICGICGNLGGRFSVLFWGQLSTEFPNYSILMI